MQALLITTGVLLFAVYVGLLPHWRDGRKKEFWVSAVSLAGGYALLAFACFERYTPGLMKPVDTFVRWLFGL